MSDDVRDRHLYPGDSGNGWAVDEIGFLHITGEDVSFTGCVIHRDHNDPDGSLLHGPGGPPLRDVQMFKHDEVTMIRALLLGHRIVGAEMGAFEVNSRIRKYTAPGRLTLDDGTQLLVIPNDGGCSCGAGDYNLTHLAAVDNIITAVTLTDERPGELDQHVGRRVSYDDDDSHRYRIFVVADAVEVNVLTVEGDDGNGYYGTGYLRSGRGAAMSDDAWMARMAARAHEWDRIEREQREAEMDDDWLNVTIVGSGATVTYDAASSPSRPFDFPAARAWRRKQKL